jgi:hypothetical protein
MLDKNKQERCYRRRSLYDDSIKTSNFLCICYSRNDTTGSIYKVTSKQSNRKEVEEDTESRFEAVIIPATLRKNWGRIKNISAWTVIVPAAIPTRYLPNTNHRPSFHIN